MNTNNLNTALYEKMTTEQEKYRDWLKSQPPEEILHHTYEYTVREDIVMAMEELELTDTQAQALLESSSPLADVYRYFEKLETGYMDVIRDSIENRADDVCRAKEELRTCLLYTSTGMVYPIYRAERKEQFEQLLRADRRNAYYTEFLPIDPNKTDQDLRDVLAHGLMDEADKKQISTLLQSGRSNSEIAYWLSRAYPREIETLDLETGDIADYRTTAQGMELEVLDAEEKRLAMLYFRWDEVAPLRRGMYARQQDGLGHLLTFNLLTP